MSSKSNANKKIKGEDIYETIELNFFEAIKGISKKLIINKDVRCTECNGSKCLKNTFTSRCYTCGGRGFILYREGYNLS